VVVFLCYFSFSYIAFYQHLTHLTQDDVHKKQNLLTLLEYPSPLCLPTMCLWCSEFRVVMSSLLCLPTMCLCVLSSVLWCLVFCVYLLCVFVLWFRVVMSSLLCLPSMCLCVLSSVLLCPLQFQHKHDALPVFTSRCS
jgi:hypothetical protein